MLFRSGQIANICWIMEKARQFQKNTYFALLTMPRPLTVWITTNWKILQEMGGGNHVVFLELRRHSRVTTEISGFLLGWPWEAQSSPRVRGKAGGCARVTAGPKRPHLGVCPGPNIPLQGRQGSRGFTPGSPGESGLISRGSQGLRPPLESRRGSLGAP